jgi:hypothetical protein
MAFQAPWRGFLPAATRARYRGLGGAAMTRWARWGYAVVLLGVALGLEAAPKVDSKYEETHYFQDWKSFAFVEIKRLPDSELAKNPDLDKTIRSGLRSGLERMGLKLVDLPAKPAEGAASMPPGVGPDFTVAYFVNISGKLDSRDVPYGVSGNFGQDFWSQGTIEGSVLVDFVDARSNQLVWRGAVRDVIVPGDVKEKDVDSAIAKLVEKFEKDRVERERKRQTR